MFIRFSVCAAWNQPEDAKDSDYTLHEKKEPDAAHPPAAKDEALAADDGLLPRSDQLDIASGATADAGSRNVGSAQRRRRGSGCGRDVQLVAAARPILTSAWPDAEPASRLPGETAVLVLAAILLVGGVPVGDEFHGAGVVVFHAGGQVAESSRPRRARFGAQPDWQQRWSRRPSPSKGCAARGSIAAIPERRKQLLCGSAVSSSEGSAVGQVDLPSEHRCSCGRPVTARRGGG